MSIIKKPISLLPLLTEVISQSAKKAALLQVLRQAEHHYTDWDNPYIVVVGRAKYPELTQMTAKEWWNTQDTQRLPERFGGGEVDYSFKTAATGAYQIIKDTLHDIIYKFDLADEDDIMTKEKQDELGWGLVKRLPGDWDNLPDQLTHEIVDQLANLWASLPYILHFGDCNSKFGANNIDKAHCFKKINGWYTKALGVEPEDVEDVEVIVTKDTYGPTNPEDILQSIDVMEKGDKGVLVTIIQTLLLYDYEIDLGEGGIDGVFQQDTQDAVLEFQRRFGLKPDGIIGPCTFYALEEGKVGYCCKSGGCKKEYCKDSNWCKWQRKTKENIVKTDKTDKTDEEEGIDKCNVKYDIGDVSEITPKAPCPELQLEQIPNSSNAWRSGQPTAEELVWIIETYGIKHIVRMNGDKPNDKSARCGGCLTTKNEEEIAEYFDVEWYGDTEHLSGGSFYSSHGKGKPGKGRNIPGGSVPKVVELIAQGNVLVHCRNGADRTGQMVGAFLSDNGWGTPEEIWDYATGFNHWGGEGGSVCKPGGNWGYIKYMEAFLPLRDWCEGGDEWRKNCPSCDPDYIENYENSW